MWMDLYNTNKMNFFDALVKTECQLETLDFWLAFLFCIILSSDLKEFICTEVERVAKQNVINRTTDHYNQPCHILIYKERYLILHPIHFLAHNWYVTNIKVMIDTS